MQTIILARDDLIKVKASANDPEAIKQAINRSGHQSFDEALTEGGDLSALLMFTEDRKEGLSAFIEKRKPKWKGE